MKGCLDLILSLFFFVITHNIACKSLKGAFGDRRMFRFHASLACSLRAKVRKEGVDEVLA